MQKFRRTKYGLVVTLAALAGLGLTTGMSSYKSVDVVVDGHTVRTGTYASETVKDFLAQDGQHVSGYDLVKPARATLLQSGMKIVVQRATPVHIVVGNRAAVQVHTLVSTVGDLVRSLHIALSKEDEVNPSVTTKLHAGMRVMIIRRRIQRTVSTEAIGYDTVRQGSSSYQTGVDVVAQPGHDGIAKVVVQREYINGKLANSHTVRTVIQAPTDEVIDVGTAQPTPVVTSRSDSSLVANEVLTVVATAYANPGAYTATGAPAGYGDVAVDPSVIPLGTKLYIPGYGYAVANDTGGAIQGYRIDLCFNSVSSALDFGRQVVKVYILGHS